MGEGVEAVIEEIDLRMMYYVFAYLHNDAWK